MQQGGVPSGGLLLAERGADPLVAEGSALLEHKRLRVARRREEHRAARAPAQPPHGLVEDDGGRCLPLADRVARGAPDDDGLVLRARCEHDVLAARVGAEGNVAHPVAVLLERLGEGPRAIVAAAPHLGGAVGPAGREERRRGGVSGGGEADAESAHRVRALRLPRGDVDRLPPCAVDAGRDENGAVGAGGGNGEAVRRRAEGDSVDAGVVGGDHVGGLPRRAVVATLPHDGLPVVAARRERNAERGVRPVDHPHRAVVAREFGQRSTGVLDARREDADGFVAGGGGHEAPVVIEARVVDGVLVLRRDLRRRHHDSQ
mmetsp:Transcript_19106/g.59319  ORF Transcript_19106/g.59319 Transcript_19106/m.59319 type:complete len:317 (-) Transcript_19106:16-966(-)|eukprot:CAMPEP_0174851408 /NCGR_PEP_ID=MMETSP1114-20130205/23175_1 /TAXON_ID=312471 /ORGANISM="Neobodo designis, Strain CCAP 1951/1" /LENGTH=316 /DNA_ID=CAMNT_0016085943 /DNA_START=84 /DNA_END=1034 /DNA_ORIENTATION=-